MKIEPNIIDENIEKEGLYTDTSISTLKEKWFNKLINKIKNIFNNRFSKGEGVTMLIEEKINKAKSIYLQLEAKVDKFKITRIKELNADLFLPM